MKLFNDYPKDLIANIETEIENYLTHNPSPHYAAFDADGTLWDIDAGEVFFEYQLNKCNLKNLPENPWKFYHDWKAHDPKGAYLWLAQINKGLPIEQVRKWGRDCLRESKNWPIFPSQRKLIHWLKNKGIRVFIVTASIKWAVEPFAELLGLHYDDVLGVETEVLNGVVSERQKGTITYKEGKSQKLLQYTDQVTPLLCSGNTMGDLQLLECSKLIKLAVSSARPNTELYQTESELKNIAVQRGWSHHTFS